MMSSLQQPLWTKLHNFTSNKGHTSHFFLPCKASHVEASLVAGNPSSLSFSVPQIGGTFFQRIIILFIYCRHLVTWQIVLIMFGNYYASKLFKYDNVNNNVFLLKV